MKFRNITTLSGTLKKLDFYDFSFTKKQIGEAKKRTYENPLLIYKKGSIFALYFLKGKLRVNYFISYYGFEEGIGEHGLGKKFDNCISCKCGKYFYPSKRITAKERLDKHLEKIKKEFEEK